MRESDQPAAASGAGHDPPAGEPAFIHIAAARGGTGQQATLRQKLLGLLLAWGRWMDGRSRPEREQAS